MNVLLLAIGVISKNSGTVQNFNIMFLLGVCAGLLSSGIYIRRNRWSLLRSYSILYLLLIPAFLLSPSKVVGFLGTGSIDQYDPVRIRIVDNYYLIEQIPITEVTSGNEMYKVVRDMGMFHKTLQRDIRIRNMEFSLEVISYEPDDHLEFKIIPQDTIKSSQIIKVDVSHELKVNPGPS
jgi:hypothetical protein